jgi:membrane associated rhomboid family serine protease
MDFASFPITILLIVANVIFSLIGFSNTDLVDKTILWPYKIKREKQWYRFITSGFLHADTMHLFFNMFSLFFFGRVIETYFKAYGLGGNIAYIALYLLALVVSDLSSYKKHQDDYNYKALGASGAVSAVIFASIIFNPWSGIYIYFVKLPAIIYAILYVVYCIYMGKQSRDNINHDAHLWGAIFGFAFTLVLIGALNPSLFPPILENLKSPRFG